jgi:signal transduction histidine kinase
MSEEELSNMFRPFYSKRKGGTGLGLSIVKQIVHIHHGLIDITSQLEKGTTVDLFFPQ